MPIPTHLVLVICRLLLVVQVGAGEVLAPWPTPNDEEHTDPACKWWDGVHEYTSNSCDSFSVSRISRMTFSQATDRARRCAASANTECILSNEIGLDIPSAFVYDVKDGLRMLVAPRILAGDREATIRFLHPTNQREHTQFLFNRTITAEYTRGDARTVETATFYDMDAFCIQALRRSIAGSCWEQLD